MFINNMDLNQREKMYLYQDQALNCNVTLQNRELWQKFHELETEMIITKSGRRMFPALRVQIENLEPNAQYCVLVEMVPVTKCRFKYSASTGWGAAGAEEAQSPNRIYLHPDSPAPGHFWTSQVVTFGRLKLTNTANPPAGQLVLSSMHKYQPRIIIVKAADPRQIPWAPHTSAAFPETQFIAVTAYQNDKITQLKIDNNPFAKGFRGDGQSKCKRKRQQMEEQEDEEIIVDDEKPQAKRPADSSRLHPNPTESETKSTTEVNSTSESLLSSPRYDSKESTHSESLLSSPRYDSKPSRHSESLLSSPRYDSKLSTHSESSSFDSSSLSFESKRSGSEASLSPRLEPKHADSEASLSPRLDISDSSSDRTSSPELNFPYRPYHHYSYPIYSPYYFYSQSHYLNYYPYFAPVAQDLRVQRLEKPKKLTDFSIRAITGMS